MNKTKLQGNNYYELLGVERDATADDLRRAKLRLIRQYSNEQYPEEFILINEAFDVLSDPAKRSQYDAVLDGGSSTYLEDKLQECFYFFEQEQYEQVEQLVKRLYIDYPFHPDVLQLYSLALHHLQHYYEEKRLYEKLIRNEDEIIAEGHLSLLIDYIISQQYVDDRNWMIYEAKQLLVRKAGQIKRTEYVHGRIRDLYERGNIVWAVVLRDLEDVLLQIGRNSSNSHFTQLANELGREADRLSNAQQGHQYEAVPTYEPQYERPTSSSRIENDYSLGGNIVFSLILFIFLHPVLGIISFAFLHFRRVAIWQKVFSIAGKAIKLIIFLVIIGFVIKLFF